MNKKSRWLQEEIDWGRQVAGHYGVDWDDEEDWDGDEGEDAPDDRALDVERARLREEFDGVVPPVGAEPVEAAAITDAVRVALAGLDAEPLTEEILATATDRLAAARNLVLDAENAVAERGRQRELLRNALQQMAPPEGAEASEAEAIRGAVGTARSGLGAEPVTVAMLETANDRVEAIRRLIADAQDAANERRLERERIRQDGALIDSEGYLQDQKLRLSQARGALADALADPVTTARNAAAADRLEDLRRVAADVAKELSDLGGKEGIESLCAEAGIDPGDYAQLEADLGGRAALSGVLKVFDAKALGALCKTFGQKALGALMAGLGGADKMKGVLDALGDAKHLKAFADAGTSGAEIAALCTDLGGDLAAALLDGGTGAADVAALHGALGSDLAAFQSFAKDSGLGSKPKALAALFKTGCKGDPARLIALFNGMDGVAQGNLKGLVETGGLGDAPEAFGSLYAEGCNGDPAMLAQFGASLNDKDAREGLKRMLTDGGLSGSPPPLAVGDIDPACLGKMLKHATGDDPKAKADGLAALFKGMDQAGCQKMKTVLTSGGLGLAPDALGQAVSVGCDGKADQMQAMVTTFSDGTNAAALQRMLTDGGMAGKAGALSDGDIDPACLGNLLKNGAGPAPGSADDRMTKMATLLKDLDSSACGKLKDMLSEGGLGQAPEALSHLVGIGCEGKADSLKVLQGGFDDADNRKGLARMLGDGGLKGKTVAGNTVIDPRCLAQLYKHGADEKPPLDPGTDEAWRAKSLGKLCKDMDKTGCDALAVTLETGKLGLEPEVMAKFVGVGCKGGGAELKAIATELGKSDNNARLGNLLQTGGFGTKDGSGAPVPDAAKTECLGKLLRPGCDGTPAEMTRLLQKLDAQEMSDFKGLMTSGKLGQNPDVLANLYKHGCVKSPDGPADGVGEKDPKVLVDMMATFRGPVEVAKFEDMLTNGGFTGAGNEERLGSVMRYAFTPKTPPGSPQDGAKLKEMCTAFTGHMPDLKMTMDALTGASDDILETSQPGEPNQPGKGLRNVVHAPGHGGNANQLHSKFVTNLRNRATGGPPGGPATVPRLTLDELIQNAASLEHDTSHNAVVATVGPEGPTNIRMDHIVERHTRKHCNFTLKPPANNTPITLYARTVDEAAVKGMVDSAMGNMAMTQPLLETDLEPPPGNTYKFEDNVDDGSGGTAKIGFNPDPDPPPGNAYVAQFFPRNAPGQRKIRNRDMYGIKAALI